MNSQGLLFKKSKLYAKPLFYFLSIISDISTHEKGPERGKVNKLTLEVEGIAGFLIQEGKVLLWAIFF